MPRQITVSEDEFSEIVENGMGGFCIDCAEFYERVEPDAERYRCDICQVNSVYGAEMLLLQGDLKFKED